MRMAMPRYSLRVSKSSSRVTTPWNFLGIQSAYAADVLTSNVGIVDLLQHEGAFRGHTHIRRLGGHGDEA